MKRCKTVVVILTLIFVVILAGCSKDKNEVAECNRTQMDTDSVLPTDLA